MATFTITIPDDIVAEANEAAARTNDRQPAKERQLGPLAFGDKEATDVVYQWLHNLIITDFQQSQAIAGEQSVRAKAIDLASRRTSSEKM